MSVAKKSFVGVIVFLLSLCAVGPMPRIFAEGHIYNFSIKSADPYLIAGNRYSISYTLEKPSGSFTTTEIQYSTSNGLNWNSFGDVLHFILPLDSQLTSAIFRVNVDFGAVFLGPAASHSDQTIGPFKIMQPGSATDVTAVPNENGSVTIAWTDNSNMESYYQITRDGPDGTKTFYVKNTTDYFGPLSYVDNSTNKYVSTIYAYSVLPVIDQYSLPDNNKPGAVSALVKTIAQKRSLDSIDALKNIPLLTEPDTSILTFKTQFNDRWSKYILDIDKVPVSSVTLNKKVITLMKGESEALTATVVPANAANQKVAWSSDNPQVANVDSAGKVTAISPGVAKIIVKTDSGGLTGVCIVTVPEMPAPPPVKLELGFTDIAGHWANEYITKAVAMGFVSGYPDGTFRPDEGITRAEFTNMLMKGIMPMTEGTPLVFKDKKDVGVWAVKSVEQAVKLGIISGYADGTFRPQANITHAEMISMVVRASGIPADQVKPTSFTDDKDIPKWAKATVSTAELTGIIIVSGLTDNKFAPQTKSTRAEAASAIVQMLRIRK
ncbi:S-layer homology domain-containing protein [Cohnella silvisoli]|uniref:S-layer homology domain-containing protein n=1 Tax=Cohnella silvisoli TaxID=2873699 RepID=A0ABV1KYY1_9BACL|nr:S-layer homology domain-containing protein [Cohnella silvisoli]MCD9021823.1 S-layer homology domain-containing protein [Cohnella silvisoli]